MQAATLCFLLVQNPGEEDRVWLAEKLRRWGIRKLNGYGGRIEKGESVRDSLIREVRKECGIQLRNPVQYGRIKTGVRGDEHFDIHVFLELDCVEVPQPSEEMGPPTSFPIGSLPWLRMPIGTDFWLPCILRRERVARELFFSARGEVELMRHPPIDF